MELNTIRTFTVNALGQFNKLASAADEPPQPPLVPSQQAQPMEDDEKLQPSQAEGRKLRRFR